MLYINNSIDKSDNGKSIPLKYEIVLVDDANYGLCIGARNFTTGRLFALYKSCKDCQSDLGISMQNLSLIELASVSNVHKSCNHAYYYNDISTRDIKDYLFEQNTMPCCKSL